MPTADSWTINLLTGPAKGAPLNGCTITRTAMQTQIFPPNDTTAAGTVNSVTPPIEFDSLSLPGSGDKFNVTVKSFTHGPNHDEAHGDWVPDGDNPGGDPNGGEWTAVSTGAPAAEDEKLAADKKAAAADSN